MLGGEVFDKMLAFVPHIVGVWRIRFRLFCQVVAFARRKAKTRKPTNSDFGMLSFCNLPLLRPVIQKHILFEYLSGVANMQKVENTTKSHDRQA